MDFKILSKILVIVMGISLIQGCATQYQSKGLSGGFSEVKLEENVFRVSFRGNAYTDMQRALDFTLLRSAELALQNGYRYFTIINSDNYNKVTESTAPGRSYTTGNIYSTGNYATLNSTTTTYPSSTRTSVRPRAVNTIVCYISKPTGIDSYNARFIYNSIRSSYGITD